MSGLDNSLLLGADAAAGGYTISRSLRFNSADSAYLSRTPASAGNRKTWTWAGWVKRPKLNSGSAWLCNYDVNGYNGFNFGFTNAFGSVPADVIRIVELGGSTPFNTELVTTQVFRDPSAWYHVVLAYDTTQATAANRVKLYLNGVQITTFSTATYPSQNFDGYVNKAETYYIGKYGAISTYQNDYLADIHFIDGQALDPTSFGEFSATTGVWMPKAYTGSYGTNGFRLTFADNSAATATTLGKDAAGSNNWTPNNLSVTAGAGNDSLVDVPVNGSEVDTGAGGQVRGNHCVMNPLTATSVYTLTNGNLDISCTSTSAPVALGTIAVNSGKWYWEMTLGDGYAYPGVAKIDSRSSVGFLGASTGQFMYNTGTPSASYVNGSTYNYSTAATATTNDVIGVALDFDTNTVTFYKNGVSQGAFGSNLLGTDTWAPAFKSNSTTSAVFNFGQRPFAYTAPSGFKALCTANLPAPTITQPSTVMDVALYTGNGSTQTITLPGGMSPDLVWIKGRSVGYGHRVFDTVRGTGGLLYTNATDAEVAQPNANDTFSSFNSNGFSLGAGIGLNQSSATYAAWCWDAGSSTVTNTAGSISSQVRANASAGFSIVSYTGTGANATVGHGLGVAPSMIIIKERSQGTGGWIVYHASIGSGGALYLNMTQVVVTASTWFNSTSPTSTVFSLGANGELNDNGQTNIAYCFAPVAGYSAFGSYTGNGSTDGPFVYTGFRPRWILLKDSTNAGSWELIDTARIGYNGANYRLFPNLSDAEFADHRVDILSNGFKLRVGAGSAINSSNAVIVYAAFAESPFGLNNRAR